MQPLLGLLKLMEVEHDGHLATIQPATQKAWYEHGKFRAEITEKHGHKKADALTFLNELGLIQEVHAPSPGPYLGSALMGAKIIGVRKRMANLVRKVDCNVTVGKLFLLGSTRGLFPDEVQSLHVESPILEFRPDYVQSDVPVANESEMMALVWKQSWPVLDNMRHVIVQNERANSLDTIQAWKDQCNPPPGAYLIATSQPDVTYHTYLAGRVFGEGYTFHGIGPTANLEIPFSTFLHGIAVMINVIYEDWMKR